MMNMAGPSIATLALTLMRASQREKQADDLGRYWQNMVPLSSAAAQFGDHVDDPGIERKKKALQKSWPELARYIETIANATYRD